MRELSIDAFRGLTIVVMIFVNQLAGVSGMPQWARHMPANADAMSFVDGVFPAFLFIVGMSIPFALRQRRQLGDSLLQMNRHVIERAAGLIILGLFMVNAEDGYNAQAMQLGIAPWSLLFYVAAFFIWSNVFYRVTWLKRSACVLGALMLIALACCYRSGGQGQGGMTVQWWGILGLIGWAYFCSAIIFQISRGKAVWLSAAIALCFGYYAIAHSLYGHPDYLFSQDANAAHTAISLCGILFSQSLFAAETSSRQRLLRAGGMFLACVLVAVWLRPYFGISKIYATPSWCLFSVAACILIFLLLQYALQSQVLARCLAYLQPVARQPLLAYLLPFILEALMQTLGWEWPRTWMTAGAGVLFSCVYVVVIVLLVRWLVKNKLQFQL